ncbi:ribokinase [Polycladidibacter hongkongensis]|uniref:ribokinase n=1 Tax=Polycladidibacter hongkongensis TaxID=1647556 RepID=UPI0008311167|nr:ribokinase [Pseudovibrio hongkongensis]
MIVVFGSINLDLVVPVKRLPSPGETVSGPSHEHFPGGKGANQALAAARAGAKVAMVGAVGSDPFSAAALSNMQQAEVNLDCVHHLDGATGLALIGVDENAENQIIVASGVNAQVDARWLPKSMVLSDTLVVQMEVPGVAVADAMRKAKAAGARTLLNTAPFRVDAAPQLLELADIVVANETEAQELAAALKAPEALEDFAAFLAASGKKLVITLGAKGAVAHDGERFMRVSSPNVKAVDTTGAGDAFVGAFAAALDAGRSFASAMKYASAAGGLACTKTGAQSSAPSKQDIAALAATIDLV